MTNDRRTFLKCLGTAGTLAALPAVVGAGRAAAEPDLVIRLYAGTDSAQIWPGAPTPLLRYRAAVVSGRRDAVRELAGTLGPVLDLRRGERVRVFFENRTGEPSIVHWHGMLVPERADGHPRFAIGSGDRYVYDFTVRNRAGTYLYHPHPHGLTGKQVYFGLAGLVIVRDAAEADIGLPDEAHELALVIQDRRVGADNRLEFRTTMMDDMRGVLGDRVLVNGIADAQYRVSLDAYRLRLANVSNARIYKLAWSDGRPMKVIASDNGLFGRDIGIQQRPYVVLAPFERVEVYEDFGARRPGTVISLVSNPFSGATEGDPMGGGMMGRMMQGGMMDRMMGGSMMGAAQGDELVVAKFSITGKRQAFAKSLRLPERTEEPARGGTELYTRLSFRHMHGLLNGRTFDMSAVAEDERLPVGETSLWTFHNEGGGMMAMPHPMHIHGVRFRILDRGPDRVPVDLRDGLIDVGFKDTFPIFPGERVQALIAPTEPGLFMYHCHNLEHEDGGMMRNCRFG